MEGTLGSIMMWAMNWAPQNWALCNGQLLSIMEYQALFSLLGTTYGGDGRTTFALPDLQGRMPIGMGSGRGLTPRVLGSDIGKESISLNQDNLPAHSHMLQASTSDTSLSHTPTANWTLGAPALYSTDRVPVVTPAYIYNSDLTSATVASAPTTTAGKNIPLDAMPPALCVSFIICINGYYPQRP